MCDFCTGAEPLLGYLFALKKPNINLSKHRLISILAAGESFSMAQAQQNIHKQQYRGRALLSWVVALSCVGASAPSWAQGSVGAAGEVEFVRGVGFAQSPGQTPRTLGRGLPLKEGDRLTTADGATAILKLDDGTRMTVRPNSELVLSQYKYRQDAQDNSMVMQLFRGGLRAITGLIAKSSPNAARIQTNTATIGIRGTDFDARICAKDCAIEAARTNERAKPNTIQASAKVLTSRGEVMAVDGAGQRRRLVDGGGVYPGDVVETGQGTQAILAFRDESRVAIGATSRFRVDSFVYDRSSAGEGRMLVSLLKGTVRALSGLIAKANNKNVGYSTSTATIGIRGTEMLIRCTGVCAGEPGGADDGLTVFTYSGLVDVTRQGAGNNQVVSLSPQQGLFLNEQGSNSLSAEPVNDLPQPGSLPLPPSLFDSSNVNENEEGLYVFVREGHIEITNNSQTLHLGRNEAGFSGLPGIVTRPDFIPRFVEFDRIPLPNARNFTVATLLGDSDIRVSRVCR